VSKLIEVTGLAIRSEGRSPLVRASLRAHGFSDAQLTHLWADRGSGLYCDGCGRPIDRDDFEYQLEFQQGERHLTLLFHVDCWEAAQTPDERVGPTQTG
jgi:hypothetical protein